jgi:gluconolactonase
MDAQFEVLVGDCKLAEGPVWLGRRDVSFVELGSQRIRRWRDGQVDLVAMPGGAPNGATLGPDGALYVANNGGISPLSMDVFWRADDGVTGRIQRVSLDGQVEDVVTDLPGPQPWRPNDLRFGPDGLLYFTDPHNWEDLRGPKPELYGGGSVCRVREGRAEIVARIGDFPNGLAFSPDGARLFVAQTQTHRVLVMDVADGTVGEPEVFCTIPEGGPDGMAFDTRGRLWVCGALDNDGGQGIFAYAPDGGLVVSLGLPAGSDPTNLCIGDGGLYVTLGRAGALIFVAHEAEPARLLFG